MSHDQLFKELLQTFLPEFVALFLPQEAAQLDWASLEFLDKEVFTDLGEGSRRMVDLVARVQTREGQPELLLIHVEVEADPRGEFPSRMYEYYAMLRLRYRLPVLPVAVFLRPGFGGVGTGRYEEKVFGLRTLQFEFHHIGLPDISYRDVPQNNPVTHALAPLLRERPADPVELVLASLRGITQTARDEARQALLAGFLSAYAPLDAAQSAELSALLGHNGDEEIFRMLTVWHKQGIEEGREEGREEGQIDGMRRGIRRVLNKRCGAVDPRLDAALERISDAGMLDELLDAAATVESLEEFQARLPGWALE